MAIEWVKKGKMGGCNYAPDKDVFVSAPRRGNQDGKKGKRNASFSFRNGSERRITATGFANAGIEGGRIYFREATEDDGYKLIDNTGKANTFTLRVSDERMERICGKCRGGYNLEYDRIEGLYYIKLVKSEAQE